MLSCSSFSLAFGCREAAALAYLEAKPWPPAQRGAFVQAIAQAALQRTSALGQTIHFLLSLPPELLPSHIGHPFIDQLLRCASRPEAPNPVLTLGGQ